MGEFELIAAIRDRLAKPEGRLLLGPGDDAAISAPTGVTATSVDAIVEDVHFRRATTPLEAVGRKALAAGLSDLAAMGARAGEAYLVLGVPEGLSEDDCLRVFGGAAELAERCETTLAGGDVTRSATLFVSVTVVGHADSAEQLVTRGGGAVGDLVAVTGQLGGAAAGLALLGPEAAEAKLAQSVAGALRGRQLEPRPRLGEGQALAGAGASAMIDISDGLGADASHLAAESGLRIEIELSELPLQQGVAEVAEATGRDPFELAAAGGEDYELLACIPEQALDRAREAVVAAGGALTAIGRCAAGEGVGLSAPGGGELEPRGFDQLS